MQRKLIITIACGAALGAALMLKPAPVADPAAAPPAAGYRVYIDPASGEITSTPSGPDAVDIDKDIQNALSTSSEGLEVVPAPGGGVMVDLRGRFQHVSVATIDENGNLSAPCLSGLPDADREEAHDE